MVTIDQYNSEVRQSLLTGVLRAFVADLRYATIVVVKYVFARRDTDIQRRRVALAAKISAQAGLSTAEAVAEPARLTSVMMAEYLQPCAIESIRSADSATATTQDIENSLNRIDYELATIRTDIALYLP